MNAVKVTSGKWRGRVLTAPGGATHPMGAREKLALFNMLTDYLPDARVLDAFAGSGALGIEALSRGAKKGVFIEKSPKAARIIRENLTTLRAGGEIFIGTVQNYSGNDEFDIILADPPYDNFKAEEVATLVKLLKDGGIFALSHPGEAPEIAGLNLKKTSRYAGARISLYSKH